MFSHFLPGNKPRSAPKNLVKFNHSPSFDGINNNYNGPPSSSGGQNWSVWNLLPSSIAKTTGTATSRKSSSKYYYKNAAALPQDRHYEQQRHQLIDQTDCGTPPGPRDIEMDYLNPKQRNDNHKVHLDEGEDEDEDKENRLMISYPTPPMSPSLFILPRCMQEQCYSPVKLSAASDRSMKRIEFRSDDCDSLIEKFDKITIMDRRVANNGSRLERPDNDGGEKRRNDREEIRRRLAMGNEDDYLSRSYALSTGDRPTKKPSLQSRLQNGMNLQICFMNETASDTESPSSDSETCPKLSKSVSATSSLNHSMAPASLAAVSPTSNRSSRLSLEGSGGWSPSPTHSNVRPNSLKLGSKLTLDNEPSGGVGGAAAMTAITVEGGDLQEDFYARQTRLQMQARVALAQAKDLARMEMEMERQRQRQSPITELIRNSVEKVGVVLAPEKRRVSRQILTDMNIAQLQVIVNDLHSHIEVLNESLVRYLLERDELHMSQDSMLVDIEDRTKYLEAKDQALSTTTSNCDIKMTTTTMAKNQPKKAPQKQFGITSGGRWRTTTRAAMDNHREDEDDAEEDEEADERSSIKFQLFSSVGGGVGRNSANNHPQSSRNLMNNNKNNNNLNINNNSPVYNATTTTGTVLNGPSKLFRIPNLVRK